MENDIFKKAIFPIAGFATRFLPLSKAIPKELIPLADKPLLHYSIKEAVDSNIKEIIFVIQPEQREFLKYLFDNARLKSFLEERKKEEALKILNELNDLFQKVSFSFVPQKEPLGDAHAIFQAHNLIGNEACGVFFSDDVIDAEVPAMQQLKDVFKTAKCPVVALKQIPKEKLSNYGIVKVEKLANSIYKIKGTVEKPSPEKAPSNLAIVGRSIITPEVFEYIKSFKIKKGAEISLTQVFNKMVQDGKTIYGYEIKGEWLECGDISRWFFSFIYLALRHPKFGPQIKEYLKSLKLL